MIIESLASNFKKGNTGKIGNSIKVIKNAITPKIPEIAILLAFIILRLCLRIFYCF